MSKPIIVYTCSIGADYELQDVSHFRAENKNLRFICFSDRQQGASNGWEIIRTNSRFPSDPFRSSREMKILPHKFFRDADVSLYVDTTVDFLKCPSLLINYLLPSQQTLLGLFYHSFRNQLSDEFAAVQRAGLDYTFNIVEQLAAYKADYNHLLSYKPLWGGIIARRHNEVTCVEAMEMWFMHVLRYSRRDQLSLPIALFNTPKSAVNVVSADIRHSAHHQWPKRYDKPAHHKLDQFELKVAQSVLNSARINSARQKGVITYAGFMFSTKHKRMNAALISALLNNTYEAPELKLINKHISPSDRVLEAGILTGATTMTIAKIVSEANVLAYEADIANADLARNNFTLNNLTIALRNRVLGNRKSMPEKVTFFPNANPSSSSILKRKGSHQGVEVRVDDFETVIAEFKPTTLCFDIEGGEIDLLCSTTSFGCVKKILLETHARITGEDAIKNLLSHLDYHGFRVIDKVGDEFIALSRAE